MKPCPEPEHDGYFVYMLCCNDGSLYTGWTRNLKSRLQVHNKGKGAKYTRARLPVALVFYREFQTKNDAMSYESKVKKLTRAQKISLLSPKVAHMRVF